MRIGMAPETNRGLCCYQALHLPMLPLCGILVIGVFGGDDSLSMDMSVLVDELKDASDAGPAYCVDALGAVPS